MATCHCQRCSYCDRALGSRHEHDHFPLPLELGGLETRPACIDCHDLKDRFPLDTWPMDLMVAAAKQIDPSSPSALLAVAWARGALDAYDQVPGWDAYEEDLDWRHGTADAFATATDALPYPGRLLMAKMTKLALLGYEDRRVKAGRLF